MAEEDGELLAEREQGRAALKVGRAKVPEGLEEVLVELGRLELFDEVVEFAHQLLRARTNSTVAPSPAEEDIAIFFGST